MVKSNCLQDIDIPPVLEDLWTDIHLQSRGRSARTCMSCLWETVVFQVMFVCIVSPVYHSPVYYVYHSPPYISLCKSTMQPCLVLYSLISSCQPCQFSCLVSHS